MAEIKLTQGKVALVDDDMCELLMSLKWHAARSGRNWYAARTKRVYPGRGGFRTEFMHHFIVGKPLKGFEVDHINNNGLDNRRKNLRVCSREENHQNERKRRKCKSQYKGIHHARAGWIARITVNKERLYLGVFKTEKEAAKAYNESAKKYFKIYKINNI